MASFSASTLLNGSRVFRIAKPLCQNSVCCRALARVTRFAVRLTRSETSVVTRWIGRPSGPEFEGLRLLTSSSRLVALARGVSLAVSADAVRESRAGVAVVGAWRELGPAQRSRFCACTVMAALAVHALLNPGSLWSGGGALVFVMISAAVAVLLLYPEGAARGWAEWSSRHKFTQSR